MRGDGEREGKIVFVYLPLGGGVGIGFPFIPSFISRFNSQLHLSIFCFEWMQQWIYFSCIPFHSSFSFLISGLRLVSPFSFPYPFHAVSMSECGGKGMEVKSFKHSINPSIYATYLPYPHFLSSHRCVEDTSVPPPFLLSLPFFSSLSILFSTLFILSYTRDE